MSRRRGKKSKRRSGIVSLKAKVVFWLVLLLVIAWSGTTLVRAYQVVDKIEPLAGHDFITEENPQIATIMVIRQSLQPAQLDSLAILRVNYLREEVAIISIPPQLSDGQTSVGQYIEGRYYKEAQIAVEQQLAQPINGYVVQTRAQTTDSQSQESIVDMFTTKSPIGLWSATGGLPLVLGDMAPFYTNLSAYDLWRTAWFMAKSPRSDIAVDLPNSAISNQNAKPTLIAEVVDPIVQSKLIDDDVAQQKTTVVVKNGTVVSGLATQMSRFIANSGGEVVAIESASANLDSSSLTTDSPSALSEIMSRYLGIEATQQAKTGRERADMELVVGADALTRLGQ